MLLQTAVQEFSHQERFSALQALLDGRLLECQRRAHIIRGVFAGEPKLSCQVSLNDQGKVSGRCDCGQPRCLHQAALVIEQAAHSAVEEQGRSRRSDTAIRLFRSDLKERFDPFPTMARHRILYLLALSETGLQLKVLKGYLNKNGRYQLKGPLGFDLLQSQPVPKYVSQTDLKLLHLLREVAGEVTGETFNSETSPSISPDISPETSSENLRADSTQSQLPEYLSPAVSRLDALAEQQQVSQAGASLEQAILIDLKCSLANDAFGSQPLSSEHLAVLDSDFYRLLFASGRCFFGKVAGEPVRLATHYDEDYLDESFMLPLCPGVWLDTCSGTGIIDKRGDVRVNQTLLEGADLDGDWLPRLEIARESLEQHWHEPMLSPIDVAKFSMVHRGRRYDFESLSYLGAGHKAFMAQFAKCQLLLNPLPLLTSQFEPAVTESLGEGLRLVPGEASEHVVLLRTLSLKGWQVELVAKQRFVQVAANAWYGEVNSADKDWFELSLGVEVEGKRVNLLPLLVNLIRQGKLSRDFNQVTSADQSDATHSESQPQEVALELESGAILTLPAARIQRILAVLDELFAQQPLNDQEKLVLARHHLGRIPLLDDALSHSEQALTWSGEAKLRQHAKALGRYLNEQQSRRADRLGTIDFVTPDGLNAELRPYQIEGVAWLQFIKRHGFGAILADDMGLGKTLQTLCSILLDKQAGVTKAPVLVIAPTSLLSNWQREIAQFTPSLTSFIWSGRSRHDNEQALTHVDVLITSYGILAQDAERLTKLNWHQVILDEAQTIKNSRSRITKLVNRLQTKHRLCLTGTPMENHLGELWSLFHFLMPGFLGTATQFQRQFKQPIEKDHCDTSRQRLAQRLAPFMLRRTKRQVATELPTKTVINTLIELSQSQSDLYETIRLTVAEQVQLALRQTGAKANRLMISNALLKLRQVCCHPSMLNLAQAGERAHLAEASSGGETSRMNAAYDGGQDELNAESSKLAWLENKLPSMIEDGRNILIFSSFTSMLDLIAEQLDRQQIGYEMLTGRSRHRDRIIERFRRGEVNVFLISLKAGGSGLNLTEADVVIHVDPWWNPAAEEQASDRAYRIGQDKPVFVYKLICQNTVEERIQQLQQSKQALAQSMYQTESLTAAEMDKDDWLALLQPITEQPIAD
ncbi:DEAD/DEAH box helicase [Shewanella aquimarina]|uniref:DEAD/DEAH box helicase n=1 Tax=Shewanella aquimarina TaxID=260365 RepID=UPI002014E638|nr:DEAD/DEAH box helicase [Shewanella aquimarina]MCL2909513.1 DEAD/DEAH box helicase [Shewanella aquimarina]